MTDKNDLFEILIKRIDKLSNSLDNLINIQLSKELKSKGVHNDNDNDYLDDMRKRKRRKLNNSTYQEVNNLEIKNIPDKNNSVILDNLEEINKTLKTLSLDSSKSSIINNHKLLINKYREQDDFDNHDDMRHLYIN
jgi:hypothetical protein